MSERVGAAELAWVEVGAERSSVYVDAAQNAECRIT